MDPRQTLIDIVIEASSTFDDDAGDRVLELVSALAGWLARKGYQPDWAEIEGIAERAIRDREENWERANR